MVIIAPWPSTVQGSACIIPRMSRVRTDQEYLSGAIISSEIQNYISSWTKIKSS